MDEATLDQVEMTRWDLRPNCWHWLNSHGCVGDSAQQKKKSYVINAAFAKLSVFWGFVVKPADKKKSHLFTAGLSRPLLGVVNITMVSFGRQPWSGGKVYKDRKTAFVDRGFPSVSNPLINADSGLLQWLNCNLNCFM